MFRCLHFADLNLQENPEHRRVLDDIRNQYFGGSLLMRMRGDRRMSEKGPAIAGLYNKITRREPIPKGKNHSGRIRRTKKMVKFADNP